jgi:hypothetical protein
MGLEDTTAKVNTQNLGNACDATSDFEECRRLSDSVRPVPIDPNFAITSYP